MSKEVILNMQVASLLSFPRKEWSRKHAQVMRFLFEYGRKQTLREDYIKLAQANEYILLQPGTSLLTATVRGETGPVLIGASFIKDYGEEAFLIAVHPLYRRKGIGISLLSEQLALLGKMQCQAGLNQIPFLNLCFRAGLTASSLTKDSSGRALLNLVGDSNNTVRLQAASIKEGETLCRFPS
ncbi:GNAT family N-acetyltransferase [Paenibacillus sp. J23TS9]|uniref:GNAT family N-acetyltransferase n=1 Tax=Paenibacillus sp. J23TS9 TaxID=2807193 RepID=UPI001BCEC860|nr:GNAT family N-acetyltransferase [Paenibacillus sp. J23TS9]